jgi:serine/threonine protein kinase
VHGLEDALASNEPAFLNQLEHSRIVPVREAQWDPEQGDRAITFVMPLLAGGSVADALKEDYRFSIAQAITIAMDALDALAYLRREFNALHRDTKPGNVLLDKDRTRGYLSDFGSAATVDADGQAAAVLGTHIYRPPEARSVGVVGSDADVYGIGMMLFEMLNGRIAWETLDLEQVERRLQRGLRAVPDSSWSLPRTFPTASAAASARRSTAIRRSATNRPRRSSPHCGRCGASTGVIRTAQGCRARGSAPGHPASRRSAAPSTG